MPDTTQRYPSAFKWLSVAAALIAITCTVAWLSRFHNNCGGNSAAMATCQQYLLFIANAGQQSPQEGFRDRLVTSESRPLLTRLAHNHWIGPARFLVLTAPRSEQRINGKEIVIVCDTPFSNVPERWIGTAPMSHAAGFADGSVELISPAQFAALDRSAYGYLDAVVAQISDDSQQGTHTPGKLPR